MWKSALLFTSESEETWALSTDKVSLSEYWIFVFYATKDPAYPSANVQLLPWGHCPEALSQLYYLIFVDCSLTHLVWFLAKGLNKVFLGCN